jgi:hypothetical protein
VQPACGAKLLLRAASAWILKIRGQQTAARTRYGDCDSDRDLASDCRFSTHYFSLDGITLNFPDVHTVVAESCDFRGKD